MMLPPLRNPEAKMISRDNEGQAAINITRESPDMDRQLLSKTKPVLKKSIIYSGTNALLVFRSIEITVIETLEGGRERLHTPLYVPVTQLEELLKLSSKALELRLLSSLHQDKKTHLYTYSEKPSKQREEAKVDDMPDVIRSSLYRVEEGKDFRVVFKMPQLEFSVLSKNFTFIKVLTRSEVQEYLDASFLGWDEMLLKHCL
jgi:hypothetical protein